MKTLTFFIVFILIGLLPMLLWSECDAARTAKIFSSTGYTVVDTGQIKCYNNSVEIVCPSSGHSFHGQDAQYDGNQPTYVDNGDGTITDLKTGLMWQKTPDLVNKSTFDEAVAGAGTLNLAGYTDWRLPTIKELYSLIDFS